MQSNREAPPRPQTTAMDASHCPDGFPDREGAQSVQWAGQSNKQREAHRHPVNAGEILHRQAEVRIHHGIEQEGRRYRGPSCFRISIDPGLWFCRRLLPAPTRSSPGVMVALPRNECVHRGRFIATEHIKSALIGIRQVMNMVRRSGLRALPDARGRFGTAGLGKVVARREWFTSGGASEGVGGSFSVRGWSCVRGDRSGGRALGHCAGGRRRDVL
jgi:hypothetical protein